MKNIRLIVSILLAGSLLMVSCRKEGEELLNPNKRFASTYAEQFEAVWHGIDNSYVFWSRDNTDWDAIYEEYKPRFAELDNMSKVPDSVFTDLWVKVVGGLLDHHFVLTVENYKSPSRTSAEIASDIPKVFRIGGSAREVRQRPDYRATDRTRQDSILEHHSRLNTIYINKDNSEMRAALLNKSNGKKIAYFRLSGFNVSNLFNGKTPNRGASSAFIESEDVFIRPMVSFYGKNWMAATYGANISSTYANGWINDDDVEGIIYDVRGNGGGNADELTPLVGALTQSPTHYGYSRTKEGLGRLDYSAWTPFIMHTPANHLNTAKPIVVLADANSYSCAEITTQLIHSLPNGVFIGKRTGGATCPLLPGGFNILLSGVFGTSATTVFDNAKNKNVRNPNWLGYYCYTSNFDLVITDYTSLEGKGVTPDYDVDYKGENGKDEQLDAAIEYLETGRVSQ